jgi:hypothetical protein
MTNKNKNFRKRYLEKLKKIKENNSILNKRKILSYKKPNNNHVSHRTISSKNKIHSYKKPNNNHVSHRSIINKNKIHSYKKPNNNHVSHRSIINENKIPSYKKPYDNDVSHRSIINESKIHSYKKPDDNYVSHRSIINESKIHSYKKPDDNYVSHRSIINENEISLYKKPNYANGKSFINKGKIQKYKFPPPKYMIIRNNHIPRNLKELNRGETYNKCNKKTGYIFMPKEKFKFSPNNLPMQIKVIPIYLILTKNTLKFLMGPKEISMFNEIYLENIQKITQIYPNSFCFDLIENNVIENTLTKVPISLCSRNAINMQNWITAIQEFKECNINIANNYDNEDDNGNGKENSNDDMQQKVLIDFEKINQLLKPHKMNLENSKEFDPLYYNKEGVNKNLNTKTNMIEFSNVLNKIVHTIEGGNINEQKIKRNYNSEILKAQKFAFDFKKKTEILDELIQKRQMREKEKEEKLIKYETKARELRLLKAVLERIKQYKVY